MLLLLVPLALVALRCRFSPAAAAHVAFRGRFFPFAAHR
jgi:hypothetical protein